MKPTVKCPQQETVVEQNMYENSSMASMADIPDDITDEKAYEDIYEVMNSNDPSEHVYTALDKS